ncbi:hypothetical protein ACH5RR_024466 [Cinchona calisaya]|uniref:Uncharacterized protein n=1 Tax=Cinchona calisaya TaxID=153742 RepID=A0ABD2YZH8_9GENT
MAPHGEAIVSSYTLTNNFNKPRRLSNDNLKRTTSDISFELSKETIDVTLTPISEVEDAKCECCGMIEEYTLEYVDKVRGKFCGKWICGLCAEAVKEEMEKNGGKIEEALEAHMNACFRFNKFGRAYPVLSQAQAMREMFRKSVSMDGRGGGKSVNPKDKSAQKKGQIARSSSCIPAITREMNGFRFAN